MEAVTIQEANELGETVTTRKANYFGVGIELANVVNNHLAARIREGIPGLSRKKPFDEIVVADRNKRALMGTMDNGSGNRVLYLYRRAADPEKFAKEWDRSRQAQEETGSPLYASSHLPREKMVESVLDHEIGHVVYDDLPPARVKEWKQLFKSVPRPEWSKVSQMVERHPREAFQECFLLALNEKSHLIPEPLRALVVQMARGAKA